MWYWLRSLVALMAAVLVLVLAGTAWLLSGDRYQTLLTEQLSQLLGAEVRVSGNRFSLTRGLGIELTGVTIQLPNKGVPFLTSERVDVLLGLKALLRGRLLFHQLNAIRPQMYIAEGSDGGLTRIVGLLSAVEKAVTAQPGTTGWFTPTLAIRHVGIYDGSVTYVRKSQRDVSFVFTRLYLLVSRSGGVGAAVQGNISLGAKGEFGTVALQAAAPTWSAQFEQWQVVWHGSVQLRHVASHQLGRIFGREWPHATLSADLHYDGKSRGPVHVDGTIDARNLQVGGVHLHTVAGNIAQLQWKSDKPKAPVTWREYLHAVTAEVHLDHLQGGMSDRARQFSLSKGTLTLRDGVLTVRGLSGDYGKKSRLLAGEVVIPHFATRADSDVSAVFEADMSLQEDLDELVTTLAKFKLVNADWQVQQLRGRAATTISMYSPHFPTGLSFEAELALHQVAFRLPSIKPEVTDLTGNVRVTNKFMETTTTTPLSLKLGGSRIQVSGQLVDYLSPQRKIKVHLNSDLALSELPEWEKSLTRVRGTSAKIEKGPLTQFVTNPQGRAQVQLDIQTAIPSGVISYAGTVIFQQAAMTLAQWNLTLNGLAGIVRVEKEALATDDLTFEIDGAPIHLKGVARDYLTSQQSGEGTIAFTKVNDAIVAPLLPLKLVVPQGGTFEGKIDIHVPREGGRSSEGIVALNDVLLDPLPKVFHPFDIVQGRLDWQGKNINLMITQGSSPGGTFIGNGRIVNVSPLNLELAVDFADLDLGAAFKLDQPKVEDPRPKNDTVQVQVKLHAGHLQYKTFAAEHVQAACYWHSRQADLQVMESQTASGTLKGDATLWPDSDELYLTPQVVGVDVRRLLSMLNTSSEKITGALNGEGKIYIPDWHVWADLARWRANGSLAIADGVAQQIPLLVRLWSAVSLQQLLSFQLPSLANDGLAFSTLAGDFVLGGGVAVTSNLSLVGSSVRIEAVGEIDLVQRTLDLKTSLMPLHGITSSVAKVPLAGELIARGAEMLMTLPFRVRGSYHDPTVMPLVVDLGQR